MSTSENVEFPFEIESDEIDVDYENQDGNTPLMIDSRQGNLDIVEILLENEADVNHQNENGDTTLKFASRQGNLDIVNLLEDHIKKQQETILREYLFYVEGAGIPYPGTLPIYIEQIIDHPNLFDSYTVDFNSPKQEPEVFIDL